MTDRAGGARRRTLRNIAALYGVQMATYLLPLVTVPFLARTLGPQAWGALAVAQAFGGMMSLLVDYGFDLSGTREVARVQDQPARRAELLSGVLGARLVMTLCVAALTLVAQATVPALQQPLLLWAAVLWGVAQATSLMWYFQGLERVTRVAGLDVAAKVAVTAGILLLIRRPSDAWLVPGLTAVATLLSNGYAFRLAHRDTPFLWPTWSGTRATLRLGWSMFVFRGSAAFYSTASAFLLSLFVPVGLVGFYAAAERIARAVQGLLTPLHRALYPRFARAAAAGPAAARALLPSGLWLMGGAGAVLSAVTWLAAPLLISLLLGPGFERALPVLRALSVLPLIIGVNMVFGLFWLVPLGHDRAFNITVALGALLNAVLIVLLVPGRGPLGMAEAVVLTELTVGAGLYFVYRQTLRPMTAQVLPVEA
ncbi:flippase [Deinococcus navajonensis]|uniref:Flippase n=1 Tax=Deinococcus navajonensis TaxID=309884 RepID=A0ABV8XQ89_9DEIO